MIAPTFFSNDFTNYAPTFVIIGVAGFISSFTTSTGARLLLVNRDKEYARNIIISAGITIFLSIILYYILGNELYLIALSILFGELLLSILNIVSIHEKEFVVKRLKAIIPFAIVALLFIAINFIFDESIYIYITFLIVLGTIVILNSRNKLNIT